MPIHISPVYVDVVLPLALPGCFTYLVPEHLHSACATGKRVIVQFGRRKLYSALIRRMHSNKPEGYQIKAIESVLDSEPLLSETHLCFWDWISQYYLCSPGEVLNAALPSGLKLESETRVHLRREPDEGQELNTQELLLCEVLAREPSLSIADIRSQFRDENILPMINRLLKADILSVSEAVKEVYKPRKEKYVRLSLRFQADDALRALFATLERAPAQLDLLMRWLHLVRTEHKWGGLLPRRILLEDKAASPAAFDALVKKGVFEVEEREISRLLQYGDENLQVKELNTYQQKALTEIEGHFDRSQVVLLHGVTSSGKTEIYIQLISKVIEAGKQVLYLVPEIALTTQLVSRLRKAFGDKVGVYHSRFNDAERVEIWNRTARPTTDSLGYRLVIGARSSVFLPFSNLGLVIVDEEHESSFKQFDPAPRYHARDAAIYLARLSGASVLLGTATPSIESYYNAVNGKYALVELMQRHDDVALPAIEIIDTRKARKRKQMQSLFSRELVDAVIQALDNREQVILFQNRRGYAPFLECEACSWVPKCSQCDVSLTFHRQRNALVCHYCGFSLRPPEKCAACGTPSPSIRGYGTERIEDDAAVLFPQAAIARMDLDTTRAKRAFEEMIASFEQQTTNMLIGTQMIAKGLDFSHVRVVGILNADQMLLYPDFRSYERGFQLMAQVAGRAGRKTGMGRVLIQTSSPELPVLRFVKNNDYSGMYHSQLRERKAYSYPPFSRLVFIYVKHKSSEMAKDAATALRRELEPLTYAIVLGPEAPLIGRMEGFHIQHIMVKLPRNNSHAAAKDMIREAMEKIRSDRRYGSLHVYADVDPM